MEFPSLAESFWNRQIKFEVQAPLTDQMVARAEEKLGVKLPAAYVTLVRIQNGGHTSDAFQAHPAPEPTSWAADHVPFNSMFGIGEEDEGILQTPYLLSEWGMPDSLVLLTGDGHWWIALDYRDRGPTDEPSVIWYDNEMDEDIELARDFTTFVQGLRNEEAFDIE